MFETTLCSGPSILVNKQHLKYVVSDDFGKAVLYLTHNKGEIETATIRTNEDYAKVVKKIKAAK